MPKPLKSQWQFGELFPTEATRRVFSVSELTLTVRRLIEGQVGRVWVTGEVTNFRLQSSGHAYFAVKDVGAQLSCVLFRDEARSVKRDWLEDGQKVVLQGEMTVYEARGQYQLRVTAVELQGVGALQAAFERLKQKLNAEGLFAPERKRQLPRYPQRIGVVTSPTGAAIRDVLHVIQRRNPSLEVILASCRVQGQGAAAEIANAIQLLNEFNARSGRREAALPQGKIESQSLLTSAATSLDLILVTRGGGSLEDLWVFNEEIVARAIFESKLPVVSAVGHEIDFTISDFVADVRAATPSAAAEIITEGAFSSRQFVAEATGHLRFLAVRRIADARDALLQMTQRLSRVRPRGRLQDIGQRLDDLQAVLLRCTRFGVRTQRSVLNVLFERMARLRPSQTLLRRREELLRLCCALTETMSLHLAERKARYDTAAARLRLLSPTNVLERGYSITMDAVTGQVVHDGSKVQVRQKLKTKLKSGEIVSVAESCS